MNLSKQISNFIEKSDHYDADERNMAIRDLIDLLKQEHAESISPKDQAKIVETVMKRLADSHGDVSTITVKSLPTIIPMLSNEQLIQLLHKLGTLICTSEENADTLADGLKTTLQSIDLYNNEYEKTDLKKILEDLTGKFIDGANKSTLELDKMATEESGIVDHIAIQLSVTSELLEKFGNELTSLSCSPVVAKLLKLLNHKNAQIRQASARTLGALMPIVPERLFGKVISELTNKIVEVSNNLEYLFTYIQTVVIISSNAPSRIGDRLSSIVESLTDFVNIPNDPKQIPDEKRMELWENCLKALSSIIQHCPHEMSSHIKLIIDRATYFSTYDPYVADDNAEDIGIGDMSLDDGNDVDDWDNEANNEIDEDGWGDDDNDEDDDDNDDDGWDNDDKFIKLNSSVASDTTWKIRLAAISILKSFIHCISHLLGPYYESILLSLLKEFKGREPVVKLQAIECCYDLLKISAIQDDNDVKIINMNSSVAINNDEKMDDITPPKLVRRKSLYELMSKHAKSVVDKCISEYVSSDLLCKAGLCNVINALVSSYCQDSDLSSEMDKIIPILIDASNTEQNTQLALHGLRALRVCLVYHSFDVMAPFAEQIVNLSIKQLDETSNDDVCTASIRVLMSVTKGLATAKNYDKKLLQNIFNRIFSQVKVFDTSEKVKEATIETMSVLIANFGVDFKRQTSQVIKHFLEFLDNKGMQIWSLQALILIARSKFSENFPSLFSDKVIVSVLDLINSVEHDVQQNALECIRSIVIGCSKKIKSKTLNKIVSKCIECLNEAQFSFHHSALYIVSDCVNVHYDIVNYIVNSNLSEKIIHFTLTIDPIPNIVESLIEFYRTIICCDLNASKIERSETKRSKTDTAYEIFKKGLLSNLPEQINEESLHMIAQCLSELVNNQATKDHSVRIDMIRECINSISQNNAKSLKIVLSLYLIGELGCRVDLSEEFKSFQIIYACFNNSDVRVKHAASYALGNIAVGNLSKFLPMLLETIRNEKDQDYRFFMLRSFKEMIVTCRQNEHLQTNFAPHNEAVCNFLMTFSKTTDDSVRELVADCIASVTTFVNCAHLSSYLPKLLNSKDIEDKLTAAVILRYSAKYCNNKDIPALNEFYVLLNDDHQKLRYQIMKAFADVIQVNATNVKDHVVADLLPVVLYECDFKPELVEELVFGSDKEIRDLGEPNRIQAIHLFKVLIKYLPNEIPLETIVDRILKTFNTDKSTEILQEIADIMSFLASNKGNELLPYLESFAIPWTKSIKPLLKSLGKQTAKSMEDSKTCRDMVIVIMKCYRIPGLKEQSPRFARFHEAILKTKALKSILDHITANDILQ